MATVTTTLTATVLTGCGTTEESETETGKKVVLADTVKDENAEVGVVQSKENIEAETDVEQAYDDFLQDKNLTFVLSFEGRM